jgi:hypothetical protein
MAQNVVNKSGAVTNALRVGANVGNAIVTNLNRAGLADVPMIGTASRLAETGTNALSREATKLDAKRDQMAKQIRGMSFSWYRIHLMEICLQNNL